MRLSQVAGFCDGRLSGADVEFSRVCTDTRDIRPGDLFVALRGERFDGQNFIGDAAKSGAVAALCEQPVAQLPAVVVGDSRRALGLLAAGWAAQYSLARIAVTGNAGKTTVKEMIACMLSSRPGDTAVHATKGNLNNDIGVPLTLLGVNGGHRYGVFELGANAPGEIAWTCSLVRPQIVMITNVTGAHLEGFGSMQGIADAKAEIYSATAADAVAIVNADDQFAGFFTTQALQAGLRVVTVGQYSGADWSAEQVSLNGSAVDFVLLHEARRYNVHLPLPGAHQVSNALVAIAAVVEAGVAIDEALPRLTQLKPVKGRMNMQACMGGTLVDDSYNANPGSVRVVIDWLSAQPAPRALVLGNLAELGPDEMEIHKQLGEYARSAGLDRLITVGALAAQAAQAFGQGAEQADGYHSAAELARSVLSQGGTVLVKGSRSAGMEAVITALQLIEETH
ncbi:UDP-N-acetylmuramoyl-tripeptide--D-alanyl-D-alanine ligase [Alcanivorax sp. 1008]|uniref:UDP-N-acetylmuramoyl-tripeptide--D-alanyl-D- alanine ligase n=1 Tax=Alcanivorax sp. 1008 TaxID=2816853 RepID=UPI001D353ECC|nr:UDP-N-acetylmuramoyl-tripeptide--D-alanyl-D-alanine ligase [Alcanivorax sp. 1008]MCC1495268.1 UDP-N-acetylmuramoyl-tripeptide--D-alanyl-D-alanine ligase [Alcanivorax sp. 1008]